MSEKRMDLKAQESLTSGHIPVLDGARGLAILLVMLYHQTVIRGSGSLRIFTKVMSIGWCGVDLFFVLSGFLITGILYDSKNQPDYFLNFYARRILRIFPLYYGILFFTLIILPRFPHPKIANFSRISGTEFWYWVYLQNYVIAYVQAWRHGILDITWSLAIEEQFYLCWPLAVFFLDRIKLMRTCVVLIFSAFLVRIVAVNLLKNEYAAYVLLPCRMDALAIGALLALIAKREDAMKKISVWFKPVAAISFFTVILCIVLGKTTEALAGPPALIDKYSYTFIALLFGCVLGLALNSSRSGGIVGRFFENRTLRIFGKYSYAMYLFHMPIRGFIRDVVLKPSQFREIAGSELLGQIFFYFISTLLTFLLAYLSWHLYEKRFINLKKYFYYNKNNIRYA